MMKTLLNKISLNRYKDSKNPFKRLYYFIKVKELQYRASRFLKDYDALDTNVLLEFLSICRMVGYEGDPSNDEFKWKILFLDYEDTHYARIEITYERIEVIISTKLIDPTNIDLEYYEMDKDMKFNYTLTDTYNRLGYLKVKKTDTTRKIYKMNIILKDCMRLSVQQILKEV